DPKPPGQARGGSGRPGGTPQGAPKGRLRTAYEAYSARVRQARVGVSWLWRQAGAGLRTVLLVGAGVVAAGTAYLAGPVVAAVAGQVWGWASGLAGWAG